MSLRRRPIFELAEFLGRRVTGGRPELSAGRVTLGRRSNRGVSGGADNQDPEGRGVMASKRTEAPTLDWPPPKDLRYPIPIQKETDHD